MNNELYERAIKHWGVDLQYGMLGEEMAELTIAINKFRRDKATLIDVIDEVVDVQIMVEQMKVLFGINAECFKEVYDKKIERLKIMIENEEK